MRGIGRYGVMMFSRALPADKKDMIGTFLTAALALLLALIDASPASAQGTPPQQPRRPSQGLFRGEPAESANREALFLTLSFLESYDSNVIGIEEGEQPGADPSGVYTRAQAGLAYRYQTDRVAFGSTGTAIFDYYPRYKEQQYAGTISQPVDSYDASVSGRMRFGRSTWSATQTIQYMPYLLLDAIPIGSSLNPPVFEPGNPVLAPELVLLSANSLIYGTSTSYSAPVARRSSITAYYGFQGGDFARSWTDLQSHTAGASFNQQVSRTGRLRASYAYTNAQYDQVGFPRQTIESQDIEFGYSYLRALSPSRSVGFHLGSGGGLLRGQLTSDLLDDRTRYHVLGYGGLNYQFGRSWSADADFRRSLHLLRGLAQPYFGNEVSVGVNGALTQRWDLSASARYVDAEVGVETEARGYEARDASVRLRYALSRHFALSAEYLHVEYTFGTTASLPTGVRRRSNRDIARVGVTFGTLLYRR